MKKPNHPRGGVSLTELAIVLSIVGIILGAIWVYASQAFETARRQQLAEELTTVVNNIRSLYAGQASICGFFGPLTLQLATQYAIPSTMVRTNGCTAAGNGNVCVDTPWTPVANITNGSFAVESGMPSPPGPPGTSPTALLTPCGVNGRQQFTIELRSLTQAACIGIVPQDSSSGSAPGLQDVIINSTDIMTGAATHSLPVQVTDTQNLCTAAPNTVDFIYRLQAPAF